MMYVFATLQRSSKMASHDDAMLEFVTAAAGDLDISVASLLASDSVILRTSASHRAKSGATLDSFWLDGEWCMTDFADDGLRHWIHFSTAGLSAVPKPPPRFFD